MKKLIFLAMVLAACVGMSQAGTTAFQAGKENPHKNLPGNVSGYVKDYIITIVGSNGTDTLGGTQAFMLPEAGEIMRAWLLTNDSTMAADTVTNYWTSEVFTNYSLTVDTAYSLTTLHDVTSASRLTTNSKRVMTATSEVRKRQIDKGGVCLFKWTAHGTPTHFPKMVRCYLLVRPKSFPRPDTTDNYYR